MKRRSDVMRAHRTNRRTAKRQAREGRSGRHIRVLTIQPRADPRLERVFASIGVPEQTPFQPDPFQIDALGAISRADCLVTAPTGAGKTWIAEQAIAGTLQKGGRSWYASPLKALSNSKHAEFGATFGEENVGILTGDRKENADAPVIVGTTEILRNQLYDAMHLGQDLDANLVVLDEAHFMGDPDRGVVWEEVMIYLPARVSLLMLSATVGNADQIADWLASVRGKTCIVVEATERPVELYPLFFHPSGTLLPLLSPGSKRFKLDKKVRAYIEKKNPPLLAHPRELPPFGDMVRVLRKYHLLPAIFFLKSRSDCDQALDLCTGNQPKGAKRRERLHERIEELVGGHPHLMRHHQLRHLRHLAVGAHHGGQLPPWKMILETLMIEGLLDAVFATSTVAAGVNFPARSVVFFHSDRFDGRQFAPLTPTEFHQMIGRAGRRGMDRIGFAITVPGPTMDVEAIEQLLASAPSGVLSRVQISFSMVMNLLLSHTPAEIERILTKSFAAYLQMKGRQKTLMRDFARHLAFLQQQGYVTTEGVLTDTGRWASQLRVDQPLLIAESLQRGVLPASDPALLAAILASFVHERETDDMLDSRSLPRNLERTFVTVKRSLQPFMTRLKKAGFETRPLYLRPAAAMYAWATEQRWQRAASIAQMADGDLTMLVSRTADNLRHIGTLSDAFPRTARTAGEAAEMIMREPVIMWYG
jgi:ATP-dependent RNA helicase HelY